MAQYRRPTPNKRQASRLAPQTRSLARPPLLADLPQRVVYGKAYEATIAECRRTCQVKALPQGVGKMTRYEVRAPEDA
jgi:hypothetical protein